MTRPTPRLQELQHHARSADVAMDPRELGTARQTRHSFSRQLIRQAVAEHWSVTRRIFDIDADGRGLAVYRADLGGHIVEQVIFSQVIDESERTDRVIAQSWDVTSALCVDEVSADDIDSLREQVTQQEDGRAEDRALIWARANRSQRYFQYVVDRLKSGWQPEAAEMSDAAYILRSTAFYGNGKWGLRDFDGIGKDHPLGTPYRAQMLSAWLLREFSADLAEHCASKQSPHAVALDRQWRRYLGLGNATGLGMVPYVIRHPQVLDAWVAVRELPLVAAMEHEWTPESSEWARVIALLERAARYFSEKTSFSTDPYPSGPELASALGEVVGWAREFQTSGSIHGTPTRTPGHALHVACAERSTEVRQIVDSVLVEVDPSLDRDIESLLRCEDRTRLSPEMSVAELRRIVDENHSWAGAFDFAQAAQSSLFWFYSRNNQEPRRGSRQSDPGVVTEHPVGVARDIQALLVDLGGSASDLTVGEFVALYPQHWGVVERIQSTDGLPYTEARVNPLSEDFLPLDLQRFQLALYGMENFNPQSTDWLRVTLYGGAPTVADVMEATADDDWLFRPRPEAVG